jgi:hypothetical protein
MLRRHKAAIFYFNEVKEPAENWQQSTASTQVAFSSRWENWIELAGNM